MRNLPQIVGFTGSIGSPLQAPVRNSTPRLPLQCRKTEPLRDGSPKEDVQIERVRFTHSRPNQSGRRPVQRNRPTAGRWHRSAYIAVSEARVLRERHLSRIFPAHPRSLARHLSRARRHSSFCFALTPAIPNRTCRGPMRAPFGSGFPEKNFPAASARTGEILLRSLHRKARLRPWERGTSRRFAQEYPEGNPGKYEQEK